MYYIVYIVYSNTLNEIIRGSLIDRQTDRYLIWCLLARLLQGNDGSMEGVTLGCDGP